MTQDEIQEKISGLEKTYKQLEDTIDQSTGNRLDAAIRMLTGCGNELLKYRNMLR